MSENIDPSPESVQEPAESESNPPSKTAKSPARKAGKKAAKKSAKDKLSEKKAPEEKAPLAKEDSSEKNQKKFEDADAASPAVSNEADSKGGQGNKGSGSSSRRRRSRGSSRDSVKAKPNSSHDPDQLAKYAWKIYLAEISEEGVTMIDDAAAKVLARRCFEMASTFLDEQAFRSGQ